MFSKFYSIAGHTIELRSPYPAFSISSWKPFLLTPPEEKVKPECSCIFLPSALEKIPAEIRSSFLKFYESESWWDPQALPESSFGNYTVKMDPQSKDILILFFDKLRISPALVRIVLSLILFRIHHVLLHASFVNTPDMRLIFSGVSGTGKTTIASLFQRSGFSMVHDDRVALGREFPQTYASVLPELGVKDTFSAPVSHLFFIKHAKENFLRKMTSSEAVQAILANAAWPFTNRKMIENRMHFVREIAGSVPAWELGFVPDPQVVPFLISHI